MIHRGLLAIAILLFAAATPSASAQASPSREPLAQGGLTLAEPGSRLTVYLLTMGPGDQLWEKFGHNAIWIHNAALATDSAYHWGLFDFADKDFIPRFIQGRMRYSMGGFDMAGTVDAYRRANRTVWAQELNMTPAERQRLAEFIAWNNRPENRLYHYDYYRDNCSTRVRDAIDRALGGPIRSATENLPSRSTYRFHTARLTQDDWPVFTGTMIGLGQPVDRPISVWEEMFLPVRMKDRLASVRIARPGGPVPLVMNEQVLVQAQRPAEDTVVRRGMLGYFAISTVILGLGFLLLRIGGRGGRGTAALGLATLWSVIAGIAGTVLVGLWAFTDHIYSYRNENVLQLTPVSLILAALLVRLIWVRRESLDSVNSDSAHRGALKLARIVALVSAAGFVLQVLPSFSQVNGSVIALVMPLHMGVVALLISLGREPITAEPELE